MFPKVQFIITSHSPLLPLGMEKRFGADGFQLIEMPTASPISVERFSEFLRSFEMYQATKTFEETLKKVAAAGKPLVIGEGQTDPLYLQTAAELLGFTDVVEGVEFTSIGDLDGTDRKTRGQGQLKKAFDIYRVTLPLLGRNVLCLFDQKSVEQVKAEPYSNERLSVRSLPLIQGHPHCNDGPENLLPPILFTDEYYITKVHLNGTTKIEKRELRKVAFADYVHFEHFKPLLEEIRGILLSSSGSP